MLEDVFFSCVNVFIQMLQDIERKRKFEVHLSVRRKQLSFGLIFSAMFLVIL